MSATILLADDEADLLDLMAGFLEARGFTTISAGDGESALAAARAHDGAIDLLLTDVVMPHMSGPQLVRAVRGDRNVPRVLYVSGYVPPFEELRNGYPDARFLAKPFTLAGLERAVRETLAG